MMNMYSAIRGVLCAAAVVICTLNADATQAQTTVQVIVHSSNPASTLTTGELEAMFLKRRGRWSHGTDVIPVDLPEHSPVREAFSQQVHQKPTAAIEAFWQRQVFSGRGVPPVQRSTPGEVIEFVRTTPEAVGYVPSEIALPETVKSVLVQQGDGAAARIYNVNEIDEPPRQLSQPAVRYPTMLRQRGVEGRVVLEFVVTTEGNVDPTSIEVLEATHEQFRSPAERAIRGTAYQPGRVRGEVVAVRVQQTVAFQLGRR
jgi:TonB family protein